MWNWSVVANCTSNSSFRFREGGRGWCLRFIAADGYMAIDFLVTAVIKIRVIKITCSCPFINEPFDFMGTLDMRWADANTCRLSGLDELQYHVKAYLN